MYVNYSTDLRSFTEAPSTWVQFTVMVLIKEGNYEHVANV